MTYELEPSVTRFNEDGSEYVTRPEPEETAEMYSVYFRYTDECAHWVADFVNHDDAMKFLEWKGAI
jgi:phage-related protein